MLAKCPPLSRSMPKLLDLRERPAMKIDQKTKDWIRLELAKLEADPDYSPMIPGLEQLMEQWQESNPKMYGELQRAGLLRQLAQVIQAKIWADRDDLELDNLPATDAREQAERNWYLEPEKQTPEPLPLLELERLLNRRHQIPLYQEPGTSM